MYWFKSIRKQSSTVVSSGGFLFSHKEILESNDLKGIVRRKCPINESKRERRKPCLKKNNDDIIRKSPLKLPIICQGCRRLYDIINGLRHDKTNKMSVRQRRFRSSWASAQSDQSLRCALNG